MGKFKKLNFRECNAQGVKTYDINEVILIPKGIKSGTNLRYEKKVN